MRVIYISFLAAVLVAGISFFAATDAWAGCERWGTDPDGQTGVSGCEDYITSEGVEIEIGNPFPDKRLCYTKQGIPYDCYYWEYSISNVPKSLSAVNIGTKECVTLSSFQDSSVKIRDADPATGTVFPGGKAITLDALKVDPDSKLRVSYYTDPASIRAALMELKLNPLQIAQTLGPGCCQDVPEFSAVTIGDLTATFDACTGEETGVFLNYGTAEEQDIAPLNTEVSFCALDLNSLEFLGCETLKFGPTHGFWFDVDWRYGLSLLPPDYAGFEDGWRYYALGDKVFKEMHKAIQLGACEGGEIGLYESELYIDDRVVVYLDECGNIIEARPIIGYDSEGGFIFGDPLPSVRLYAFETDKDPTKGQTPPGGPVVDSSTGVAKGSIQFWTRGTGTLWP
jgi:hypothetical protein